MTDSTVLAPAEPVPSFCLLNTADTQIRLEDLRGRWVVLYFYPKDSTPGCTTEALEFSAAKDEFETLGCAIFGISPDSVKSHQKFSAKQNLRIDLLSDPEHAMLEHFGAWRLKKNYGKEYMGVVRSTVLIDPQGIVRHAWANVKAAGHAAAVLAKLRELR